MKTKKYMMLRMFGIVVFAIALTACSKEDDLGIKPVLPEGEAGNRLTAFLDSNEYRIASAMFDEYDLKDTCLMINSAYELPKVDFEGKPLEFPAIDFDAYTLIIGQHIVYGCGLCISGQSMTVEYPYVNLNLNVKKHDVFCPAIFIPVPLYYLGLYPKLPQTPITVNVVYK